jgi:hypothetical protein
VPRHPLILRRSVDEVDAPSGARVTVVACLGTAARVVRVPEGGDSRGELRSPPRRPFNPKT